MALTGKVNLGVLVLLLVLVISLVAVLGFLILPLALQTGPSIAASATLFRGGGPGVHSGGDRIHPALCAFSGTSNLRAHGGNFSADAVERRGKPVFAALVAAHGTSWMPLLLVIVALIANLFVLPRALPAWVGLGFGYRLAICGILLIPLGFVMGMPFPTGLRALAADPALAGPELDVPVAAK